MKKKNIYVVPGTNAWEVKQENKKTPLKTTKLKGDAVELGTKLAKENKSEPIILKKDGKIQNKNSFGNDPPPPKG